MSEAVARASVLVYCDDPSRLHQRHPRRNVAILDRAVQVSMYSRNPDPYWREWLPDSNRRRWRLDPVLQEKVPRVVVADRTTYWQTSRGIDNAAPGGVVRWMVGAREVAGEELAEVANALELCARLVYEWDPARADGHRQGRVVSVEDPRPEYASAWRAYELNCRCDVPIRRYCEHELWPVLDRLLAAGETRVSRRQLRRVLGDKAPHVH